MMKPSTWEFNKSLERYQGIDVSDKFTALQVVWDAHKSHIGDKKTALDVLKIKLGSYDNAAATIKEGEGLIASAKTDMSRNWQLCAKNRKQQHVDMLKLKMNESVKLVTRLAGTLEQTRQGYETASRDYQTWVEMTRNREPEWKKIRNMRG